MGIHFYENVLSEINLPLIIKQNVGVVHVHEKEKPYPCNFCNKRWSRPSLLKRHIRQVHSKINNNSNEQNIAEKPKMILGDFNNSENVISEALTMKQEKLESNHLKGKYFSYYEQISGMQF